MTTSRSERLTLPLVPLRDVIIYPKMVIPLFVGRAKSISCLEKAMQDDKKIFLVAQKDPSKDEPEFDDLYSVGTVATILQMLTLPDGTIKVLVEGVERAKLQRDHARNADFSAVDVILIPSKLSKKSELPALISIVKSNFIEYAKLNRKITQESLNMLDALSEPSQIADKIISSMNANFESRQKMLELTNVHARLEYLLSIIDSEMELFEVEKRIKNRVKQQMEKSQKEYYLNEQIKAIQKELNEDDDKPSEYDQLLQQAKDAKMPADVFEKVDNEIRKLRQMQPLSAEATVVRGYIDWLLQVPWSKKTKIKTDLIHAKKVLDADHFGLEKVKERVVEYLAVQLRTKNLKGPILCLVGPPGVGKTSLGQSIAKAVGRKYVRIALGGVRDEAEIRGHRRTYIGAMPGKIIQKMAKIGVKNPLFLLDEVDKMSSDMRGDPASALLEILDPEQNHTFNDHYLEVDYDLSDVMFVATSNSMNIPVPLLDRMEVIRLSGYTEDEKLNIIKNYILPKQIKNNGLSKSEIAINEHAILDIIRYYTREAGVRNLEREVAKLCRKAVTQLLVEPKLKKLTINSENLSQYLGVKRFRYGSAEEENGIGRVTGLAWTEVGGELLTIEVTNVIGKGKLIYTGSLGDVMKESIQTAMTVVRANAERLGINPDFYEKRDIHLHVPEGATPKDGPSAGIGMYTALVSSLTGNPVRSDVAMTGEVTLHGKVLPIGGLKEKLLAAHRGGIKTVLIPVDNEAELGEIPENVRKGLTIHPVSEVDDVLTMALQNNPFGAEFVQFETNKAKENDIRNDLNS